MLLEYKKLFSFLFFFFSYQCRTIQEIEKANFFFHQNLNLFQQKNKVREKLQIIMADLCQHTPKVT